MGGWHQAGFGPVPGRLFTSVLLYLSRLMYGRGDDHELMNRFAVLARTIYIAYEADIDSESVNLISTTLPTTLHSGTDRKT